jgi:hypothetical protein
MQQNLLLGLAQTPLDLALEKFIETLTVEVLVRAALFKPYIPLGMSPDPKKLDLDRSNTNLSSVIVFTDLELTILVKELFLSEEALSILYQDTKCFRLAEFTRNSYMPRIFFGLESSGKKFISQVIIVDRMLRQSISNNFDKLIFKPNLVPARKQTNLHPQSSSNSQTLTPSRKNESRKSLSR